MADLDFSIITDPDGSKLELEAELVELELKLELELDLSDKSESSNNLHSSKGEYSYDSGCDGDIISDYPPDCNIESSTEDEKLTETCVSWVGHHAPYFTSEYRDIHSEEYWNQLCLYICIHVNATNNFDVESACKAVFSEFSYKTPIKSSL